jgi:hypothetical protein
MDRKKLVKAAVELNDVIGVQPDGTSAIDIKLKEGPLAAKILEAKGFLDEEDELSPETQAVMDALVTEASEPKPATKPEKKAAKVEKKVAKPEKKAAKKADSKPGVIATIATTIKSAGKKGITKEDILKVLTKAFPDKDAKAMANTVKVQVPSRISAEKFKVERTEAGTYRAA